MKYTLFQQEWIEIARRYGLVVRVPHPVRIGERTIEVPVLLEEFGAERGMLLVTDFGALKGEHDRVIEQGYGFSTLSDPVDSSIHEESLIEMLEDWGWSGSGRPPSWYHGEHSS